MSSQTKPKVAWCLLPSTPTYTPCMNRLSIAVNSWVLTPVEVSVPTPVPSRSTPPTIPLKSVMLDGSALAPSNCMWNGAPGKIVCGIGLGSTFVAASASADGHSGAVTATPPTSADVLMNWRRVKARSQKWGWPALPSGAGKTKLPGMYIGTLLERQTALPERSVDSRWTVPSRWHLSYDQVPGISD